MATQKKAAIPGGERKAKLLKEFETIHREMEIAEYATKGNGQYVRKVPRKESIVRTRKRKLLEKDDISELALHADDNAEKRLRGSKIAFEQEVIEGSKVFGKQQQNPAKADGGSELSSESENEEHSESGRKAEEEQEEEDREDGDEGGEGDEPTAKDENNGELSDTDNEGDDEASESEQDEEINAESKLKTRHAKRSRKSNAGSAKSRRKLFKIRNFKSFRMAQRHGDALGAHARGLPKVAVEKLKQVARDAPAAPQVYSALGMVYEDMLQASLKKSRSTAAEEKSSEIQPTDELVPDAALSEQLGLAKKAYGSYHVAAILCKKDFTLWVRAADCASEVARLHSRAMLLPNMSTDAIDHHRAEKKRWLSESRHDFIAADNLKPPGIDVPAKLAEIEIELGNLSEALTILTDLKNRKSGRGGDIFSRTDFEKSYKAWLLYADLMLRIGHECTQWNRGVQSNENYMFRRWLRRFAQVFDWQERRLQGLIMALEASAGSQCCDNLLKWAKRRARMIAEGPSDDIDDKRWHISSTDTASTGVVSVAGASVNVSTVGLNGSEIHEHNLDVCKYPIGDGADMSMLQSGEGNDALLQQEKSLLLNRNIIELNDFDKTTEDMDLLIGSMAEVERRQVRNALVEQQGASLASLEVEFSEQKQLPSDGNTKKSDNQQTITYNKAQLPISGSIATVCATASELMKHCLGMQLYEGGRLVGEVVTLYFKERAAMIDQRMQSRAAFSQKQSSIDESVLLTFEPYDEINNQDDISDDESSQLLLLSDDERLEEVESTGLVDSLRRGVLPTELMVLFALCLVGEGGKDFIAAKCIESARDLELETRNWIMDEPFDVGLNPDPLWNTFRQAMTETLSRTTALSFVSDVVRKTRNEDKWCGKLAPLFRYHLQHLRSVGLLDQLRKLPPGLSSHATMRKNQLLKVVLGGAMMDIAAAELASCAGQGINDSSSIVLSIVTLLTESLESLWKVEINGSIAKTSVEALDLLSRGFTFLLERCRERKEIEVIRNELCNRVVALFCGCAVSVKENDLHDPGDSMDKWEAVPVPSSWQSDMQKAISLRVYNLCVACNVSIFSGWEKDEFSLRLLRPWRGASKFFGVNVEHGRVSGFLSTSQETELAKQLQMISNKLPWVASINFYARLAAVKESTWYKSLMDELPSKKNNSVVARHGEEAGINILLCFSKACLMFASSAEGNAIQNALSVILPMCEFCLDEQVWESDLGKASTAVSSVDDWKRLADSKPSTKEGDSNEKPKLSFPRRARVERRVDEWLSGKKDRSSLTNVIKIPALDMLKEWRKGQAEHIGLEAPVKTAKMAMDKVHFATKQLRYCYTNSATEKASAQVAVALLELAAYDECQNPILCLQHAAMFASQGSKGGNNDERFRKALPSSEKDCTPLEAMMILGRADCLQAIYFSNEAAFLCSYVARVCRQHRDRLQPELEWTPQWKVIGIMAYNLSVLIRFTVRSLLDTEAQTPGLRLWEREVVEELERCRADAVSWKKQLEGSNSNSGAERMMDPFSDEDIADDEEEMADGDEASVEDGDDDSVEGDQNDESIEGDQNDESVEGDRNEESIEGDQNDESDEGEENEDNCDDDVSNASNRIDQRNPPPVNDEALTNGLNNSYYTDEEEETMVVIAV